MQLPGIIKETNFPKLKEISLGDLKPKRTNPLNI
jgi:hypothetical protein